MQNMQNLNVGRLGHAIVKTMVTHNTLNHLGVDAGKLMRAAAVDRGVQENEAHHHSEFIFLPQMHRALV
jgi:hypothetical protein